MIKGGRVKDKNDITGQRKREWDRERGSMGEGCVCWMSTEKKKRVKGFKIRFYRFEAEPNMFKRVGATQQRFCWSQYICTLLLIILIIYCWSYLVIWLVIIFGLLIFTAVFFFFFFLWTLLMLEVCHFSALKGNGFITPCSPIIFMVSHSEEKDDSFWLTLTSWLW